MELYKRLCSQLESKNKILEENKNLLQEKKYFLQNELLTARSNGSSSSDGSGSSNQQHVIPTLNVNNAENGIKQPTYKDALSIKLKGGKSHEDTRKELITKVNPKVFNSLTVRNSRLDGTLVIESADKKQLQDNIEKYRTPKKEIAPQAKYVKNFKVKHPRNFTYCD